MGREIKFRYWNVETEEFEHGFFAVVHEQRVLERCPTTDECWVRPDLDPLQYTGLKDKNGKEIYEGDIVTCKKIIRFCYHSDGSTSGEFTFRAHEIVFNKGKFYPKGSYQDAIWYVIGNIYENPGLLDGHK